MAFAISLVSHAQLTLIIVPCPYYSHCDYFADNAFTDVQLSASHQCCMKIAVCDRHLPPSSLLAISLSSLSFSISLIFLPSFPFLLLSTRHELLSIHVLAGDFGAFGCPDGAFLLCILFPLATSTLPPPTIVHSAVLMIRVSLGQYGCRCVCMCLCLSLCGCEVCTFEL